jgi:hypothetical protein
VPRHVIVTHGLPTARQNAREVVFSEGRGLRARIVRPCKWQGVAFPTGALRLGPWPNGGQCCARRDAFLCGRAEPAPPRGGPSRARWPTGGRSEMTRNAVSSEGRTLCVRLAWPNVCRGIPFSRDGRAGPVRPRGHAPGQAEAFLAGVRSPPLRGVGYPS